jgi:hypothetical protein
MSANKAGEAKASDFAHINVEDDNTWFIRDPKKPNLEWSEMEKLLIQLNKYVMVNMLKTMKEAYEEQFPNFGVIYTKMCWVFFSPLGPGRATIELAKKMIGPFFFHREQLCNKDTDFITKTVVPSLFDEINTTELLAYIQKRDREAKVQFDSESFNSEEKAETFDTELSYVWDHLNNIETQLLEFIAKFPQVAFRHLSDKERVKILSLPINHGLMRGAAASLASSSTASTTASKTLKTPVSTASETDGKKNAIFPAKISGPPSQTNTALASQTSQSKSLPNSNHNNNNKNPSTLTNKANSNLNQASSNNNNPSQNNTRENKQREEKKYDSEEGFKQELEGGDEGDEDEEDGMEDEFNNVIGDLFQSSGIQDLIQMGKEQQHLASSDSEKQMSPEDLQKFNEKTQTKVQGLMGKLAGGLADMTSNIGSKKGKGMPKNAASERERNMNAQRFEHVLSKLTNVDVNIHANPDFILEDVENEKEEKAALEDRETRERSDVMSHFHEELLSFIWTVHETRAAPGLKLFNAAAKGSKQQRVYAPYTRLYKFCNEFFDNVNENPLTPEYFDVLSKVHECKELCHAYRKKNPAVFLGLCKADCPEGMMRVKSTRKVVNPTTQKKEVVTTERTFTNKYFRLLWKIAPSLAQLFWDIRVDQLYLSYEEFPKNIKIMWKRLGMVMQFVAILTNLKPGSSMAAMRPVLMSVLALNKVTPDHQKDPQYISKVLKGVISKFNTPTNKEGMNKACSDIIEKGDLSAPMDMFSSIFPPELAESLGLNEEDSDDDEETKTKKMKEEKATASESKDQEKKSNLNMNKMKSMFKSMFKKMGNKNGAGPENLNIDSIMNMFQSQSSPTSDSRGTPSSNTDTPPVKKSDKPLKKVNNNNGALQKPNTDDKTEPVVKPVSKLHQVDAKTTSTPTTKPTTTKTTAPKVVAAPSKPEVNSTPSVVAAKKGAKNIKESKTTSTKKFRESENDGESETVESPSDESESQNISFVVRKATKSSVATAPVTNLTSSSKPKAGTVATTTTTAPVKTIAPLPKKRITIKKTTTPSS